MRSKHLRAIVKTLCQCDVLRPFTFCIKFQVVIEVVVGEEVGDEGVIMITTRTEGEIMVIEEREIITIITITTAIEGEEVTEGGGVANKMMVIGGSGRTVENSSGKHHQVYTTFHVLLCALKFNPVNIVI